VFIAAAVNVLNVASLASAHASLQPVELSVLGQHVLDLAKDAPDGRVYDVKFSPKLGSSVCAFALDRTVQVWDLSAKPRRIATFTPPLPREFKRASTAPKPHPVSFSSDGSRLAIGYFGIQVWDFQEPKLLFAVPLLWNPEAIEFSPTDSALVVACSYRGLFRIPSPDVTGKIDVFPKVEYERMVVKNEAGFDIYAVPSTRRRFGTGPPEMANYYCLAVYPDGKRFVAGGDSVLLDLPRDRIAEPSAKVWDLATGRRILAIGDKERPIARFCLSPDGRTLYSCGKMVLGWDSTKFAPPIRSYEASGHRTISIAASSDGAMLAAGDSEGDVVVWGTDSAARLAMSHHDGGPVYRLAFSPTAAKLAAAGERGIATIWDIKLMPSKRN